MKIEYVILDKNLTFDKVSRYASLLPEYRREKIMRYRFEKDKLRSLIAGLLIRRAIGEMPLVFGEHEKPYVQGNSLYFSVSHSGDIVAIAVDDREIGMDVEGLPVEDRLKIADRFYHPREREYVHGAEDEARAFCRIWTRKEAYLKMTGEGISTDLTAFDTTSSPLRDSIDTVDLYGYCLSVCCEERIENHHINISLLELKELFSTAFL